jgi:hypothetical protein
MPGKERERETHEGHMLEDIALYIALMVMTVAICVGCVWLLYRLALDRK